MKALQYIYTSWKNGDSTDKGYMIYSKSDGITEEECNDIKQVMQYLAPKQLKINPEPEEIANDFPYSFAYFKLLSGRCCIALSTYLGKDYSGRYGNYIIYALVIEPDELTMFPVELFAEDYMKTQMTEEELNVSSPVPSLPAIEIDDYANIINNEAICEFLQDKSDEFAYLISCIIEADKRNVPFYMNDTRENLVLWVSALQKMLPLNIAKSMTFNTYLGDHEQFRLNCEIKLRFIGVRPDANYFNYEVESKSSRQIVLDFIGGQMTNDVSVSNYANAMAQSYSLDMAAIKEFNQFLVTTQYHDFNAEILSAYEVYQLLSDDVEFSFSNCDLRGLIKFADEYCDSICNSSICSKILERIDDSLPTLKLEELHIVFAFLYKYADYLSYSIYNLYYNIIFENVAENLNGDYSIINDLTEKCKAQIPNFISGYLEFFVSDECIANTKLYLEGNLNIAANIYYIKFIVKNYNLESKIESYDKLSNVLNMLLTNIYKNSTSLDDYIQVLACFEMYPKIYVDVLLGYLKRVAATGQKEKYFEMVAKQLVGFSEINTAKIEEKLLSSPETIEATIGLFVEKLKISDDVEKEFWNFYKHHIAPIASRTNIDISPIVYLYLNELKSDKQFKAVQTVLEYVNINLIKDSKTVELIVGLVENKEFKELYKLSDEHLLKLLEIAKKHSDIVDCDWIYAIKYGNNLDKIKNPNPSKDVFVSVIQDRSLNMEKITKKNYDAFLNQYLPTVIRIMTDEKDVGVVLKQFYNQKNETILFDEYVSCLKAIGKKERRLYEHIVLVTTLALINSTDFVDDKPLLNFEPTFIQYLSKQDEEDIELLENLVRNKFPGPRFKTFFIKIREKESLKDKLLGGIFKKK